MDIDLKLLIVFEEVYKTGSVSKAAANIGATQPSISISLAKLRGHFNDPLFVRTSRGMEATPKADEIIKPVREAIALLRSTLARQVVFEPLTSKRKFRIAMTDISQIVMLPLLMTHLKRVAPSVSIEILHITPETPRILESGDADLGVGFMPQLAAGFYQQMLFEQGFVCVVRKRHPRVGSKLSLAQFLAEAHIQVATPGTGHHQLLERVLKKQRIERRIALSVPSYLGVGLIVDNTDLLVIVPKRLADILLHENEDKIVPSTDKLPCYQVKQHWHERYVSDPANMWLRSTVAQLFSK
jgi:DNA-binding transcriptional LysR family regulator